MPCVRACVQCSPEIGVASTKAYTSQVLVMVLIGLMMCEDRVSFIERRTKVIEGLIASDDDCHTDGAKDGEPVEIAALLGSGLNTPETLGLVVVESLRDSVIAGWPRATRKLVPALPEAGPAQPVFKAFTQDDELMAAAAIKTQAELLKIGGENDSRARPPWSPCPSNPV